MKLLHLHLDANQYLLHVLLSNLALITAANIEQKLLRIFLITGLYFHFLLIDVLFLVDFLHKVVSNFESIPTFFKSQDLLFKDFVALFYYLN